MNALRKVISIIATDDMETVMLSDKEKHLIGKINSIFVQDGICVLNEGQENNPVVVSLVSRGYLSLSREMTIFNTPTGLWCAKSTEAAKHVMSREATT